MVRAELLKLTEMDAEAFKSLGRRDQLPFASEDGERLFRHNSYTPFEALLLLLCNDLVDKVGVDRSLAARLVEDLPLKLWSRWDDIVTAARRREDEAIESQIFCGALWLPQERRITFCGTLADLSKQPPFIRAVATNLSRSFARLRNRAAKVQVDIDEGFWLTNGEESVAGG